MELVVLPVHHVIVATLVFGIGAIGAIVRRNGLILLMSIELMLNAANLTFVAGARLHSAGGVLNVEGPIFAIFVIAVAAVEAAVGLALVIALYRRKQTVSLDLVNELGE